MALIDDTVDFINLANNIESSLDRSELQDAMLPSAGKSVAQAGAPYQLLYDLEVENIPARDFFMGLVHQTDYDIVLDQSLSGEISMSIHKATIQEVLTKVEEEFGYAWTATDKGFRIAANNITTKIYPVSYLSIHRESTSQLILESSKNSDTKEGSNTSDIKTTHNSKIWDEIRVSLTQMLSDDSQATYELNSSAGLLIVSAYPKSHKKIQQFLKKFHQGLHNQVLIEAKILEVSLNNPFNQGIQFKVELA
jgi:MSHA biogenesis protein MshL